MTDRDDTNGGDMSTDMYEFLAGLAERLATDIALAEPDWCSLANDAEELAQGLRSYCKRAS